MRASNRGKLPVVRKGLGNFQQFLNNYKFFKDHECAIHFRYATHGKKDLINAHPYEVNDGVYMMHNGVFTNVCMYDESKSDSWHFGEVISPYVDKIRDSQFQDLVSMAAEGQRLVFCDKEGIVTIEPTTWFTDEITGIQYSNTYAWDVPKHLMMQWDPDSFKPKKSVSTKNAKEGLNYPDAEDYADWWMKQNIMTYDREIDLSNRDNAIEQIVETVDPTTLDRNEMRMLCMEEPVVMARVIQRSLQRM